MDREFLRELRKIRASRLNQIIYAVNCKIPKDEAGLKTSVEKRFYDSLISEAKDYEKKYGFWPTFDMEEIESDDRIQTELKTPQKPLKNIGFCGIFYKSYF